ncbi:sulfatase-like hydrolase/transferase [Vallitaleaceae bacterium 9-2]
MKDIVLVMSDQHSFEACSLNERSSLNTTRLKTISETGINYVNAYTNAPLCVPSRMSFLTGKLPRHTKIFDNDSLLSSDVPTLAHALGARGYKTILVGRMHFKGIDQWHGFDERLVGDITSQYWGVKRRELYDYANTLKMQGCQDILGYGYSPVHDYDEQVYQEALNQLLIERDQPIFMVVGFYGPHFPYIGYEASYKNYMEAYNDEHYASEEALDQYAYLVQATNQDKRRKVKAGYYSMCQELEEKVWQIYKAFEKRLDKKDGTFVYTSDHGDQLGRRGLFGKKTFYEASIHIPLLIKPMNSQEGSVREDAVSLVDLSATLLNLADAHLPNIDGQDIMTHPKTKPVIIEQMYEKPLRYGQCIVHDQIKLLKIGRALRMFDSKTDQDISCDAPEYKEQYKAMEPFLLDDKKLLRQYEKHKREIDVLKQWGTIKQPKSESMVSFSNKIADKVRDGGK